MEDVRAWLSARLEHAEAAIRDADEVLREATATAEKLREMLALLPGRSLPSKVPVPRGPQRKVLLWALDNPDLRAEDVDDLVGEIAGSKALARLCKAGHLYRVGDHFRLTAVGEGVARDLAR